MLIAQGKKCISTFSSGEVSLTKMRQDLNSQLIHDAEGEDIGRDASLAPKGKIIFHASGFTCQHDYVHLSLALQSINGSCTLAMDCISEEKHPTGCKMSGSSLTD